MTQAVFDAARPPPPRLAGLPSLVGGALALDFANTASAREWESHRDHLGSTLDILVWATQAGALQADQAAELRTAVSGDPQLGVRLLWSALALREDIYRLARCLAAGQPAPDEALKHVVRAHALSLSVAQLRQRDQRFAWTWDARRSPLETVLGPIALSAITILCSRDLRRLRRCRGDRCGQLFLDTTKNRSRRWCEMEICGNRAKQRRFQAGAGNS